jgi:CheY-like chemotaxis protein
MPRVLLIGDHEKFRRGLEPSGALAGCEIMTAAGNVDAVRQVRACAMDVVITDTDTPVPFDLAEVDSMARLPCRSRVPILVMMRARGPGSCSGSRSQ